MQSSHRILLYNAMSESVFKRLLYCIFPRRCDLCGDVVPISSKRCDACRHCEKIEGEACEMCGMDKASCTCKDSHHKPEYEQIVAPLYNREECEMTTLRQSAMLELEKLPEDKLSFIIQIMP